MLRSIYNALLAPGTAHSPLRFSTATSAEDAPVTMLCAYGSWQRIGHDGFAPTRGAEAIGDIGGDALFAIGG